jgi:CRP/FNR family putative post-exponential-phase nitrogen-starvation transcriptional regulator
MYSIVNPEAVHTLAEQNGLTTMFSSGAIAQMELRRYSDGDAVCSVGDRLESMFILVQGKLKIHTLLPNGKSMLVRFARPMSVIGMLSCCASIRSRMRWCRLATACCWWREGSCC